jgi:protein TonB
LPAYRLPSVHDQTPVERRASGFALALGVNLLLFLVLLGIGAIPLEKRSGDAPLVVDLMPESAPAPAASRATVKPNPTRPVDVQRPKPQVKITSPIPPVKPLPWIEMTSQEMAAADIANIPKAEANPGAGGAGDSEVAGTGPNGETLYAAEWARHPTDAELGGYLPANAPDGFGLIACKTIPNDRVEDCIELDQEPRGSHLASAVRQAAWQFRIRPPRKNGRPMIGEWVSIRIDYYGRGKRSRDY